MQRYIATLENVATYYGCLCEMKMKLRTIATYSIISIHKIKQYLPSASLM
jgi:hypothetical protein